MPEQSLAGHGQEDISSALNTITARLIRSQNYSKLRQFICSKFFELKSQSITMISTWPGKRCVGNGLMMRKPWNGW